MMFNSIFADFLYRFVFVQADLKKIDFFNKGTYKA